MDKKQVREKAIVQIFEETSLKGKGFKWTQNSIYKVDGDFKLSLKFSSAISANRIEDVNILDVRAYVSHEPLRKYKKEKFNEDSGFIGGAAIANLFKAGPPWISYDLGITDDSYNDELSQIKEIIDRDVFHFFDEFKQVSKLNGYLSQPCFNFRNAIHLYIFLNEKELLAHLIEDVSVNRKHAFKQNYVSYNRRLVAGEAWIDVNKDVEDSDDRLSLEIASSFCAMGVKL